MMQRLLFLLILCGACLVGTPARYAHGVQGTDPVRVRFKGTSLFVGHQQITIGDVADLDGGNAWTRRQIAQLDLGELPRDEPKSIRRSNLHYRIRLAGISDSEFEVVGPDFANLTYQEPQELVDLLAEKLQIAANERFQLSAEELQITLGNESRPLLQQRLLDRSPDFRITPTFPTSLQLGRSLITTQLTWPNGESLSINVPVNVRLYQEGVMTRRPIARGEVIHADDIHAAVVPIERSGMRLASWEDLVGKQAGRDLPAFSVVEATSVQTVVSQPVVAVKPNTLIDLVYRSGNIEIRMKGARTVTSGAIGDWIEAINPKTQKRVRCQVVDELTAQVVVSGG